MQKIQRNWFKWVRNVENANRRWKKLALEHHPDRPGGNATLMAEINAEYQQILVELQRPQLPAPVHLAQAIPVAEPDPVVIVATVIENIPEKEKFLKEKHTSEIKKGVKSIGWALFDALVDNVERKYREKR